MIDHEVYTQFAFTSPKSFHSNFVTILDQFTYTITMLSLRTSLMRTARIASTRPLSTTSRLQKDPPPPPNIPPGAQQKGRTTSPNKDRQSSASTHTSAESKSGDDHPAKQPDPQAPAERSTGFHEIHEVKGGKEGLGARSDKPGDASS